MREASGIVVASALLTFAGMGVLQALGLAGRSIRGMLAATGLAYLSGVASTMLIGIAFLTLGASFRLSLFVGTCLILGTAGMLVARAGGARPVPLGGGTNATREGDRPPRNLRILLVVLAVLALVYLLVWLVTYVTIPVHAHDGWSIWTRKATILATSDALPKELFTGGAYTFMHQDYPLLLPALESVYFRSMGRIDTAAINAVFWLVFVAFVGAVAYLGSSVSRARVWGPVALAVVFAPFVYYQLSTGYADVLMGLMLAVALLLLARWASTSSTGDLALAALLLAGVASTKNEGIAVAVGALAAALVARREPGALRAVGLAAVGCGLAVAPWRVWTAVEGVKGDLPLARGLDPSYLWERADRVLPTLEAFAREVAKQGGWLVPLFASLVALALLAGVGRRLAVFYALAAFASLGSTLWSFAITRASLDYQIETSAGRVVMGVVCISIPALVHLGGVLDAHAREVRSPRAGAGGRT